MYLVTKIYFARKVPFWSRQIFNLHQSCIYQRIQASLRLYIPDTVQIFKSFRCYCTMPVVESRPVRNTPQFYKAALIKHL